MQRAEATVNIEWRGLWTYRATHVRERLPLTSLPHSGQQHIHGKLEIRFAGRMLSHFGMPDDACFGELLSMLIAATESLSRAPTAAYKYDCGEQGWPALELQRSGPGLVVSIVKSEYSDGEADPDFQKIRCSLVDFTDAVAALEQGFRSMLFSEAPHAADAWLRWNLHSNPTVRNGP